jgi:3-dehydroquinate dehydratase-2
MIMVSAPRLRNRRQSEIAHRRSHGITGAMNPTIFILNGPNLNLLGSREPEIYGRESLNDIEAACRAHAGKLGLGVDCRQSNHEGFLIDWIHEARAAAAGIVINPGAYSHTSVAIYDALKAFDKPVVEVHLSNLHQREAFRGHSYVSLVAKGVICGLGSIGYLAALDAMARWLGSSAPTLTTQEA